MGSRRTTNRGSPHAAPEPQPLIETNGKGAIALLEAQYAKIESLDPNDRALVEEAQSYLLADVERVFGSGSAEWSQIWKDNIINEPEYLALHDDGCDFDEGSWEKSDARGRIKAGVDKMLPRIRRLIDRAHQLAALHPSPGGDQMNPFSQLPHHPFTLIKPDGTRVEGTGIWNPGNVTVFDAKFPVAIGDRIDRKLPNGTEEHYEVLDSGFSPRFSSIPAHYKIKLRNVAHPAPGPHVVHNNTTYNNSGQVGAMGPGATATGNTIIGAATQWIGVDRDQLAAELAKLRSALVVEAGEDDDAAADLGPVGDASKALKSGDESAFVGAMRRLRSKAWGIAQKLGLAYLEHYGRTKLGLPPAGGT